MESSLRALLFVLGGLRVRAYLTFGAGFQPAIWHKQAGSLHQKMTELPQSSKVMDYAFGWSILPASPFKGHTLR